MNPDLSASGSRAVLTFILQVARCILLSPWKHIHKRAYIFNAIAEPEPITLSIIRIRG
jgi:hypothetical protein